MEAQKLIRIAYKLRIVKKHGEQPYLIDITNFISTVVEYTYVDNPSYPIRYTKSSQQPLNSNMRGLLPKEILKILKQSSKKKQKNMKDVGNKDKIRKNNANANLDR